MKAAVLYGNEDIRYVDWDTPRIQPGKVKVKVQVSGICGSDVPRVLDHGAHFYPIILGHEFVGDVVEIGEGVKDLDIGDRVVGAPLIPCMNCDDCQNGDYSLCRNYSFIGSREPGSFAEYIVIPAANAVKISSTIPYNQAVFFEPSTVALHGLLLSNYVGGENVAILGCGTIGIFTLQWAKIFGAKKIVAYDIDHDRLEIAKRSGADLTINPLEAGSVDDVEAVIQEKDFGYVFEAAGTPTTIKTALELGGNKSSICYIGTPHGTVTFSQDEWEKINRKELQLTGSWMSYSTPFPGKEWELTAHYLAEGKLLLDQELIYKEIPLSDVSKAFPLFKHPNMVKGKILLTST